MQASPNPLTFVAENTRIDRAPLVPELELFLTNTMMPLWELVESEFEEKGLAPPYWAFAWPGGQALARYVLDAPEIVRGRTVLDFAAGSGIAGIAAARAGALSVLCADIDPFAIAACRLNGQRNGVSIHTTSADLIGSDLVPEIVLAGDICYERPTAERVIAWLTQLSAQGATVLIGDPGRAYLPKSGLDPIIDYMVRTSTDLEAQEEQRTDVFRLVGAA